MASKVNTKFVITLSIAVALGFSAVVYLAVQSLRKSGEDYIALGDRAVAESKYTEAIGLYGKAVFKDQKNAEWIRKWLGAMEKSTPKGRALYSEAYMNQYLRALQALAEADRRDYEANDRWLRERWELTRLGPSLKGLEGFVLFVEETVKAFQGDAEKGKLLWRYRGIAKAGMLGFNPDLKQEELDGARKDLEGAIAVAPSDKDVMLSLVTLDLTMAERARKRDEKDQIKQFTDAATQRLDRFIADFPPASQARLLRLRLEAQAAQFAAQAEKRTLTTQEVLQDRQPKVEELVAAVVAEPCGKLEPEVVRDTARYARLSLPHPRSTEAAEQVINHAVEACPDSPVMLMLASDYVAENGNTERAQALLQRVVDMPDKPLSREGLLLFDARNRAVSKQTDTAFRAWDTEKDLEKKKAAAAQAQKFRDDFVARVGESSNSVLAIDARLAYIRGDVKGATTLLTRYNQQSKEADEDSMTLLGTLMMQQQNIGAAKQAYERVLQINERNIRALLALTKIATDAGDYSEAVRYISAAAALQPENTAFKEQEKVLRDLAGGNTQDAAIRVILKARSQMTGIDADPRKSVETLREAMNDPKNPKLADDFRMHVALIQLLVQLEDKPGAIAAIETAIAKFPSGDMNVNLKKLKENLETSDPVTAAIERVEGANAPPLAKLVAKYEILAQACEQAARKGQDDEAKARLEQAKPHLDAAVAMAPEDPQVVDARFDYALRTKNKDELRRIVELAEQKNIDQVGGQLYRARLLVVEERHTEAAQALRNVVERDRLNFAAWRLLGITQMRLNNAEAAVEAFGKARDIRPADVSSISGHIRALVSAKRVTEALAEAEKAEKIAATDPEFAEIYLYLLANAPGGDRQKAMELRQRLATIKPDNKRNKLDLAVLQIEQRRWDEAKATIDSFRTDPELKEEVVALDARWFALQGKYAEAEKVFDDLIASLPSDKRDEMPYLAAADVLTFVGQPDRAVAFLEKGRSVQKKETMLIDRQIGDVQFGANRLPEAIAAYKRVLDAGSKDDGDAVAKRMLEAYLRQSDFAKFDELLAAMGDRAKGDSTLLVLAAEAANAQGDGARASLIYDQAVTADAKNPIVFIKRADFSAKDPSKVRDAIADYEQAAKLAPNSTQAQRRMYRLYMETGKPEKAIEQLSKALAIDPGDDALRNELISVRLKNEQETEVVDLVDQAIKLKPDSIDWLLRGHAIMSSIGKFDRAADYAGRAWEKQKVLATAIPYVTALLNKTPADVDTARTVVMDKALDKADEMPKQVLRAMFYNRAKDPARCDQAMGLALGKLDQTNGSQTELFMAGLESVFTDPKSQIAAVDRFKGKTAVTGWLEVQLEVLKLRDEATAKPAAARLESVAAAAQDAQLKTSVTQLLAQYYFQTNQPEKAVTFYRKLVELNPEDAGSLNNAAYIMATKLKQPADALPLAEKAASLAPDSATTLDTLGTVHLELKNYDKSAEVLRRAVDKSTNDGELVPALIHLSRALTGQGKADEAQKVRQRAEEKMGANPQLNQQFGAELKDQAP